MGTDDGTPLDEARENMALVITVELAGGTARIRIEADEDGVLLRNVGRWTQRLTREEAWRLAEALDEAATRSLPA